MKSQQWENPDVITDLHNCSFRGSRNVLKRMLDLLCAAFGLILLSPLFTLCALLARLQSPGPAIYRAKRVGRGGRIFEMYKFRTMIMDGELVGKSLTTYEDVRITKLGHFLRWTKCDEIPQFLNVIKGDMSIVGPRPESPVYVQYYTDDQKQVLGVRPGITGPAQLANRDEEEKLKGQADPEHYYITELMPRKLEIDLRYIETRSVLVDLVWLVKSVVVILPIRKETIV